MLVMKTTEHLIGDRVSVRCKRYRSYTDSRTAPRNARKSEVAWLGGRIIGRDVMAERARYVVQLDDHRRVVAHDEDLRRFTFAFEVVEMLERMAS
jgi:hypothetical protein